MHLLLLVVLFQRLDAAHERIPHRHRTKCRSDGRVNHRLHVHSEVENAAAAAVRRRAHFPRSLRGFFCSRRASYACTARTPAFPAPLAFCFSASTNACRAFGCPLNSSSARASFFGFSSRSIAAFSVR